MNGAWERQYDDEPDPPIEHDPPDIADCLNCGHCESCIARSIAAAEENEPDDFGEDAEMEMECPYCTDGWVSTGGRLKAECAECMGTGWQ